MADVAIRVDGLGKRYRIGAFRKRHDTLRDQIVDAARSRFRRGDGRQEDQTIWALKDVSFEVKCGEVVGIIGRNGAGKSTLLKILSRITEPTEGRAEIRGRVASLLEVGTGFHPELTGRENIYLNGAILGMRKAEMDRKFDEIVAFSEVEKFIDTPVKHYSSGMHVRLAFAVAAHLEPEILLVDEVLAVGDAAFQKKCLGKMGDVALGGRTVLFVSHNMDAIRRLCGRGVLLDGGKVRMVGDARVCIADYLLRAIKPGGSVSFDPPRPMNGDIPIALHGIQLEGPNALEGGRFSARSSIRVRIDWESYSPIYKPRIGFVLQTSEGADVLTTLDAASWSIDWTPPGRRVSSCVIPGGILNEGEYVLDVGADSPNRYAFRKSRTEAVMRFEVEDDMTISGKYYGQEGFRDAKWPGVLLMDLPWVQEEFGAGNDTAEFGVAL